MPTCRRARRPHPPPLAKSPTGGRHHLQRRPQPPGHDGYAARPNPADDTTPNGAHNRQIKAGRPNPADDTTPNGAHNRQITTATPLGPTRRTTPPPTGPTTARSRRLRRSAQPDGPHHPHRGPQPPDHDGYAARHSPAGHTTPIGAPTRQVNAGRPNRRTTQPQTGRTAAGRPNRRRPWPRYTRHAGEATQPAADTNPSAWVCGRQYGRRQLRWPQPRGGQRSHP